MSSAERTLQCLPGPEGPLGPCPGPNKPYNAFRALRVYLAIVFSDVFPLSLRT